MSAQLVPDCRFPIHPGHFVRAEIIDRHGLSVTEAAVIIGVSRTALSSFLNAHASLSADMALRMDKAFNVNLEFLMRMQSDYDIAQARSRAADIDVAPYLPRAGTADPTRKAKKC